NQNEFQRINLLRKELEKLFAKSEKIYLTSKELDEFILTLQELKHFYMIDINFLK
ncbi:hypothetical protein LCGC14_2061840, partial [marine sediment metagenome]